MPSRLFRSTQFAVAIAAVGIVATTALPEAEGARKASMAENRLILDKNDVYLFPQLGVEYTNLVSFEYGFEQDEGSGLFLFGDESRAIGAGIHRGDVAGPRQYFGHDPHLGNLGPVDDVLSQQLDMTNQLLEPGDQIVAPGLFEPSIIGDLFGSIDVGNGLLGARVALGHGAAITRTDGEEDSADTQTFLGSTLGYSYRGDLRFDSSLNLQYSRGGIAEDTDLLDASFFLGGLSARLYSEIAEDVDLGALADLYYSSTNFTQFEPDGEDVNQRTANLSEAAAFVGVGPVYTIEQTTISAYAVLGYARRSADPDIDEEDYRSVASNTMIPGLNLAADIELLEWLYFRSGMQYNYGVESGSVETEEEDAPGASFRSAEFGWRAGMGLEVNNFTLDGTFQSGFLTNGPSFLGGALGDANDNDVGMFMMVAAGYQF